MKKTLTILVVSLVVFAGLWALQKQLAGEKPEQKFSEYQHSQFKEKLASLREAAAADLKDPKPHRELVTLLLDALSAPGQPNIELYKELVKELEIVSSLDPEDSSTAMMLADIYFNEKSFQKSISHYERYLKAKPDDNLARGRYASALTFMSRFKDAQAELEKVIKAEPNSFHGYAYLAITYSQMDGRMDDAYKAGSKALELAPTPEARKRFGAFLKSIGGEVPDVADGSTAEEMPQVTTARDVINYVKTNPVAGPKFDKFEFPENETLLLYFRDFPMDKMPPFAREKFLGGIKAKAAAPLEEIKFLDAVSGEEMESVAVGKRVETQDKK